MKRYGQLVFCFFLEKAFQGRQEARKEQNRVLFQFPIHPSCVSDKYVSVWGKIKFLSGLKIEE